LSSKKDKKLRKIVRAEVGEQSKTYLSTMLGSKFKTALDTRLSYSLDWDTKTL
jgi:hypothetical protein